MPRRRKKIMLNDALSWSILILQSLAPVEESVSTFVINLGFKSLVLGFIYVQFQSYVEVIKKKKKRLSTLMKLTVY